MKRRDPHALDAKTRHAGPFPDQKKEASRSACRGKVKLEDSVKKKATPWAHYDVSDLGCMLHTALRKACDSKTSSLAWNAIGAITEGWTRYLEDALPDVQKAQDPLELLDALHRHTSCSFMSDLKHREHQDLLVRLALQQLSMSDWLAIAWTFAGK